MYEVKKISAGILPTNTYVLYDSQTKCCVVVDPAFDGDKITKFIEEKGLTPVAVLLTHGHFDHCGGAKPIVEKYGVPVVLCNIMQMSAQDMEALLQNILFEIPMKEILQDNRLR